MYDWHKAYEAADLQDLIELFIDSKLRREAALHIMLMLIEHPNSRRGAVIDSLKDLGYSKATTERTLLDLERVGLISSEGKYLKTGRYRPNFSRFSSALARLSRTAKKVEQKYSDKQIYLKDFD